MLSGWGDRNAIRKAASGEQETIDELLTCAAGIGQEHDVSIQILDRVGETLQAASSDPDVARAIELGRLEREQRASGLGLAGAGTAKETRPAKKGEERRVGGGRTQGAPGGRPQAPGRRAPARRGGEAPRSESRLRSSGRARRPRSVRRRSPTRRKRSGRLRKSWRASRAGETPGCSPDLPSGDRPRRLSCLKQTQRESGKDQERRQNHDDRLDGRPCDFPVVSVSATHAEEIRHRTTRCQPCFPADPVRGKPLNG